MAETTQGAALKPHLDLFNKRIKGAVLEAVLKDQSCLPDIERVLAYQLVRLCHMRVFGCLNDECAVAATKQILALMQCWESSPHLSCKAQTPAP